MNSNSTRRWLALALPLLVLLMTFTRAEAQCDINYLAGPNPNIVFVLDAVGTADMNALSVGPYFGSSNCLERQFSTSPTGPWSNSVPFDCDDISATPQTWYVRTSELFQVPSAELPFQVSVVDVTPPTITCPASVTVGTDAPNCFAVRSYSATPNDNTSCITTSWVLTGVTAGTGMGSSIVNQAFNKGVTTVTFTVKDKGNGTVFNMTSCSFTVTVNDNDAPVVSCPASPQNVTTSADGLGNCTTTIAGLQVSAVDNCDPGTSLKYTYSVAGATTVGSTMFTGNPLNLSSVVFNKGASTVSVSVQDAAMPVNVNNTCSFVVNVDDNEAPVVTCPQTQNKQTDNNGTGDCSTTIAGFQVAATDNCDAIGALKFTYTVTGATTVPGTVVVGSPLNLSGIVFNKGASTVSVVVEDADVPTNVNNTCIITVNVVDNEAPTVAYAPVDSADVNPNDCTKVLPITLPVLGAPVVADNCPGPIVLTLDSIKVNGVSKPTFLQPWGWFIGFSGPAGPHNIQFDAGITQFYYSWTDGAGNKAKRVQTIKIKENQAPVALCKTGPIILPVGSNGQVTLTPAMVDNGSFDNCVFLDLTVTPFAFTCANVPSGLITVTFKATDANNNMSTCTTTIDVVDNTPPVVLCPPPIVVGTNAAGCSATGLTSASLTPGTFGNVQIGQYADNCIPTVSWTATNGAMPASGMSGDLSGVNFKRGATNVTFTVGDGTNSVSCTFTVTVIDTIPPVFNPGFAYSGGPISNGTTINLETAPNQCFAFFSWTEPSPIANDNCSASANISIVRSGGNPNSFFPAGTHTIIYTATDQAGNTALFSFTIVVEDTQNPTALCKPAFSIALSPTTATINVANINNGSFDNCAVKSTSIDKTSFTCSNLGANTVTLTVTDFENNVSTCTTVVTVLDITPPVAICKNASVTLNMMNTATVAASAFNNMSTDNCGVDEIFISFSPNSGFATSLTVGCAQVGTNTIYFRAEDVSNNSNTCVATLTVIDATPPSITCPAGVTVSCAGSVPVPNILGVTASDNCGGVVTVTHISSDVITGQTCPNRYTLNRTYRAVDPSSNSATCVQVIVVNDQTPPVITVNTNGVFNADSNTNCFYNNMVALATSTDICAGAVTQPVTVTSNLPGNGDGFSSTTGMGSYVIGTRILTYTSTDVCGNVATTSQTIVVNDVTPPTITCPSSVTLNSAADCDVIFTWDRPSLVANPLLEIVDCRNIIDWSEFISNANILSNVNTLFGNYNPNNANVFQQNPFADFPIGITTITYTATDASNNIGSCSFTVRVRDVTAPTITCPPNQILETICETGAVPDYRFNANVTDNCTANIVRTQSPFIGQLLSTVPSLLPLPVQAGESFTVTITATDGLLNNLSASCSFVVTLADGDAPVPNLDFLPDVIDSCGFAIVTAPSALDGCPQETIFGTTSSPVAILLPGTNPPQYKLFPGNYVLNWLYDDGDGNVSSQTQNITILADTFDPIALCQDLDIALPDNDNETAILPEWIDNGSFDACTFVTLSLSQSTFDCDDVASALGVLVTLTVTDSIGNTGTCNARVRVYDDTNPILGNVPANITISCSDPIPNEVIVTAVDNCAVDSIAFVEVSTQTIGGFGKYNYVITRTWTASDIYGNTSVYTQTITVRDLEDPTFDNDLPDTLQIFTAPDAAICGAALQFDLLPFVNDCADEDDLTFTYRIDNGSTQSGSDISGVYGVGEHVVEFMVTDASNNSSVHTLTIIVTDVTPPTAVCINNVSVSLLPSGTVTVGFNQFNNNSFDNCTPDNLLDFSIQRLDQISLPADELTFDCDDAVSFAIPIRLYVVDEYGNQSFCETFLFVQDNVAPVITCPNDVTIDCDDYADDIFFGLPAVGDNCPDNLNLFYNDDTLAQGITTCLAVVRTFIAEDGSFNVSFCEQLLNLVDTVGPVLSAYPPDITLSYCEVAQIPNPANIQGFDLNGCTSVTVDFDADTTALEQGVCGDYNFEVTYTWTATDGCGNTAVHAQTITVIDTLAPELLGLPDTLQVFSANQPPNSSCKVLVDYDVASLINDCQPDSMISVSNNAPFGNDSTDISGNYTVGEYLIVFDLEDQCGNQKLDTMLLQVIDNSIPTLICNNNIVIALGSNGEAILMSNDVDLGSNDNCGIDTLYLSQDLFTCADLGFNQISMTAVDVNGNSNACNVIIEVTVGNNNIGFTLTTTDGAESYFAAGNGTVSATATGGSGTFSYIWSNGATTSTVNNLGAGIYTITVTDTQSGCIQVGEAEVLEGAKLKFTVGNITGGQNEIVQVPVTVDNFNNVEGFKFSMHVTNTSVGTILGVDGPTVNPALTGLFANLGGPGDISVLWITAGAGVTLPNGSLAFNLNVLLSAAAFGSTSPVTIDGVPVALEFLIDSMGTTIDVPADLMNGSVTIDSTVDEIDIAGDIRTWRTPTQAVPNTTVNLTGGIISSQVTGAPGTYLFSVPSGTNTVVGAIKSTPGNSGLSSADLLLIVNHIFGATLPSPYQWVAADVNADGNISLNDYLRIQRVILGTDQNILGSPDWKFVPKSYVFPAPNPLSVPFPQNILHTPATMDFLDDDFVAVRMGDVNGSIVPSFTNDDSDDRYDGNGTFRFRLDDRSLEAGDVVDVTFRASDFNNRLAYQLTLGFDANALELADIQYGDALPKLSSDNFGVAHLDEGLLTTLWVSREAVSVADNDVLFTLRFRALNGVHSLSTVLHAGSEITRAEAYDAAGNISPIELQFVQPNGGIAEGVFALHQNQPNPFNEVTNIGFQLPESCRATLRVFNASGQLVRTVVGNFEKGFNNVELRKSEFGASGIYWYELETPTHSARKKMVLID